MRVRGSCLLVIVILWGCGGSDAPAPSALPAPSPSPGVSPAPAPAPSPAPPSNEVKVSITPFGLIPFEATVAVGGHVTFTNNDIMAHDFRAARTRITAIVLRSTR